MTPKQKAEELYYRCPIVELGDDNGIVKNDLSIKALKDVLVFLVDEILNANPKEYGNIINSIGYWNEVKKEIKEI